MFLFLIFIVAFKYYMCCYFMFSVNILLKISFAMKHKLHKSNIILLFIIIPQYSSIMIPIWM